MVPCVVGTICFSHRDQRPTTLVSELQLFCNPMSQQGCVIATSSASLVGPCSIFEDGISLAISDGQVQVRFNELFKNAALHFTDWSSLWNSIVWRGFRTGIVDAFFAASQHTEFSCSCGSSIVILNGLWSTLDSENTRILLGHTQNTITNQYKLFWNF